MSARLPRRSALASAAVLLAALLVPLTPLAAAADWGATTAEQADKQRRVALGAEHTCAVLDDGHVQCWGGNDVGQLGTGFTTTSTRPREVIGITSAIAVTAGQRHTCALLREGSVRCWGLDGSGQVGDGSPSIAPVTTPTAVQGLSGVAAVAAGAVSTCALKANGAVWCWGADGSGQLGNGSPPGETGTSGVPVQVDGITDATAIAVGDYHACALLTDKSIRCWGAGAQGRLGNGDATQDRPSPVAVTGFPDDTELVALAAGGMHACAVDGDGAAWCWGDGSEGQLGDSRSRKTEEPDPPPFAATPVKVKNIGADDDTKALVITAGALHTCAVVADRTARCWGSPSRFQLAVFPQADLKAGTPVAEPRLVSTHPAPDAPLADITALVAGGYHTCALLGSELACWGYNFTGQLGLNRQQAPAPVQTTAVLGATAVAVGNRFACALHIPAGGSDAPDAPRLPACWGDGQIGQLGSSVPDDRSDVPVTVPTLPDVVQIESGNGTTCALPRGSSTPHCWGRGTDGQLGDGTTANRTAPGPVSLTGATQVSVGGANIDSAERVAACARLSDATARCWGYNGNGQVGDNTTSARPLPVAVRRLDDSTDPPQFPVLTGVSSVSAGGDHSCAVAAGGSVWCWGEGGSGQLGNDDVEDHPAAVPAKDVSGALQVAAGRSHTCALFPVEVKCWGLGGAGQLGNGGTASSSTAVTVALPAGTDIKNQPVAIAAGHDHTCALLKGGDVWCWGLDSDGQVGDGSGGGGATPAMAVDSPDEAVLVSSISAGRRNTCATYIDLSVWCWGDNARDQIGDGVGNASAWPELLLGIRDTIGTNGVPMPQDDSATVVPAGSVEIDVLANDSDPDLDPLEVVLVSDATRGTATHDGVTVTYTPAADACESGKTDAFSYNVRDGDGATASASVSVTISCPNRDPIAGNDAVSVVEDTPQAVSVLGNDTDPDGNSLTLDSATAASHGTLSLAPDGTGTYTPNADYCGPDSVTYTVTDGLGGSDAATVALDVACVQDGPSGADDVASTPEDTPVTVAVLNNDDDADGDALQVTAVGPAGHGSAVEDTGDTIRYTPAADYCGTDHFTYTVSDGVRTGSATVTITVSCAADAPRANDDTGTTDEDTAFDLDVLANDDDPDGDALVISAVSAPAHGTATVAGGVVHYVPDADFCGADSFGYTAQDPDGNSASAVANSVAVRCTQDAPRPLDDAVQTAEDTPATFGVLQNDVDPDGDTLLVTAVSAAAHGTATVSGNGVRYVPDADFCGSEDMTYTVTDGNPGGAATATLSVTVTCAQDSPTLAAVPAQTAPWDEHVLVALSANDVDGDSLAFSLVEGPPGASVDAFGVLSWIPGSDQVGTHRLLVRVSDGGRTAEQTADVTVVRRTTSTAWSGPGSGTWSDLATSTALVTDAVTGQPVSGLTTQLRIGSGPVATATTGADGTATAGLPVTGETGSAVARAAFGGDGAWAPSTGTAAFVVLPESATVRVTGRHLTTTSATTADVALTAEVAEDQDGRLGGGLGVTNVVFTTVPGGRSCTATIASTPSGTGTATCTLSGMPIGSSAVVAVLSSSSYAAPADVTAMAVAAAATGSAVGAGEVGATHDRPAFAFQGRTDRKTGPSGSAVQVWRVETDLGSGVRPYALIARSGTLSELTRSCSGRTKTCSASLRLEDAVVDAVDLGTGGLSSVPGTAGISLWATDVGEPSGTTVPADRYAVSVTGPQPFSSGTATSQQQISRGDIRIIS